MSSKPITLIRLLETALPLLLAPGFLGFVPAPAAAQSARILERVELPEARRRGEMSLEEALDRRRSVRDFEPGSALTLAELGQLFWAAQGLNDGERRTAPSAGALYPLELYAVTRKGLYHYRPAGHEVLAAWQGGLIDSLRLRSGASRRALDRAPAIFVIAGVEGRTQAQYGARAGRYVALEAGHAAQNLLLQALSLGLGAVPIGAFDDDALRRILALPEDQTPLYLIPVGHPAVPE